MAQNIKPVKFQVAIKDFSQAWLFSQTSKLNRVVDTMAKNILHDSQMIVPRRSGHLRRSAKIISENLSATVIYPGPYAGYQERGERADGTHKVRRYTSANTGKSYLRHAGDRVTAKGIKWYLSHS